MNTKFHVIAAFTICLHLTNQSFAQTSSMVVEANPIVKNLRQPIREVTLTGTGYELGLQHGQILKRKSVNSSPNSRKKRPANWARMPTR